MKIRLIRKTILLMAFAAVSVSTAWADRGWRSAYRPVPPSSITIQTQYTSPSRFPSHAHAAHSTHAYGRTHFSGGSHRHFWGTVGVVVGATALYAAMQPRTVYYEPRVIYSPSPPVYYAPPPVVMQSDGVAGSQFMGATSIVTETVFIPSPPTSTSTAYPLSNVQEGPGSAGAQWWYACKRPVGYYPHVRECETGWEKVAATPPGAPGQVFGQ